MLLAARDAKVTTDIDVYSAPQNDYKASQRGLRLKGGRHALGIAVQWVTSESSS